MMILETVLSDRYVCQISCLSPQVKYLSDFFMLAATLFVHFPFICSTIPAAPAYGVYLSQVKCTRYNIMR